VTLESDWGIKGTVVPNTNRIVVASEDDAFIVWMKRDAGYGIVQFE